ncbi:hypothetical protein DFQ26_008554 [Actinomortierella ambigua]|nr:hypothetical protein DFQ26_008554 [Actinomortierella ambigua]
MIKKRALDAMETSIDQVSAADAKVTGLLLDEFKGEPLAIAHFFKKTGQEELPSDGAALKTQRDPPVDANEPATAPPPTKAKKRRTSKSACASPPTETAESKKRRTEARAKRHADLDHRKFWKLASGRCVEDILFEAAVRGHANVKQRSYTIDFNCERTKSLFKDAEWSEMKAFDNFTLPKLPKSTTDYVLAVRSALRRGEHPASVPVPRDDRYSCDLVLRTFLSWTSLYAEEPSPFANSALTEAFWCREAWPLLKNLLSDVKGISMIDGEKHGTESSRHRNRSRVADQESTTTRKRSGAKLDLIAHDSVNKRDWFVVESPKEWDEQSTKFLKELDVKVFRNLHLIAAHRLAEPHSTEFRKEARFFSLYAGGRGFVTMEDCMKTTIAKYNECIRKQEEAATRDEDSDHDAWLYQPSRSHVFDSTLCSSPIDPEDDDDLDGDLE